jgi:hypothetical protein
MPRIAASVLQAALGGSADALAAELLARLRAPGAEAMPAKATRPFARRSAWRIYRRKAAAGDRPTVRTDGYPALLSALDADSAGEIIVHGVTFPDTVYLVFTDPARRECLGVLRKRRLNRGT